MNRLTPQRAYRLEKARHNFDQIVTEISTKLEEVRPTIKHLPDNQGHSVSVSTTFGPDSMFADSQRLFDELIVASFIENGWTECIIQYSEDNGERAGLISVTLHS